LTSSPAAPRRRRVIPSSGSLPLLFGVAVGLYAAWLDSNNEASDGNWTAVIGVVSGAVTAVVCQVLGRVRHSMALVPRAAAFGAVLGCVLGFLFSLSGWSPLKASVGGLIAGAAMGAASYYVFHTREE
jgi:CHASE2 domain-containing sensor protein